MSLDEAGNVRFINGNAVNLALPVKGRQRVELEQNQTLWRSRGNVQLGKAMNRAKALLRLSKERVSRQQHIHADAAKTAFDEEFIFPVDRNFRELIERWQ